MIGEGSEGRARELCEGGFGGVQGEGEVSEERGRGEESEVGGDMGHDFLGFGLIFIGLGFWGLWG